MQLPIKAHYAALAMLALAARFQSGQLLAARTIADQQRIPSQFLGQILQQLRNAGLITSVRGSNGGFKLACPPAQISLADVVEAVCCPSNGETLAEKEDTLSCVVAGVWRELSEIQNDFLQRLTLADLSQRLVPDAAGMFYI